MDKFLKDFTPRYAKLFDGVRHDSGDPYEWAEKMINHYQSININPDTKLLFFSDSLTLEKAAEINKWLTYTKMHLKNSFGIGTALTNNIPGITPLNNVIKLVEANGKPVAKLSNDPGKGMCEDENYLDYLKWVIK
jgi:nicotinate phosphoribosyltransferase